MKEEENKVEYTAEYIEENADILNWSECSNVATWDKFSLELFKKFSHEINFENLTLNKNLNPIFLLSLKEQYPINRISLFLREDITEILIKENIELFSNNMSDFLLLARNRFLSNDFKKEMGITYLEYTDPEDDFFSKIEVSYSMKKINLFISNCKKENKKRRGL